MDEVGWSTPLGHNRRANSLLPPAIMEAERLPIVVRRQAFSDCMVVGELGSVSVVREWHPAGTDVDRTGAVDQHVGC